MAIPAKLESVSTNLPSFQLEKVIRALEDGNATEVPGTHSLFAESRGWEIDFEGARYAVSEFVEEVYSVRLISATPTFTQVLIDELEGQLSEVVSVREYDRAKKINSKIEDLKTLYPR